PEQAMGKQATSLSDIYALGIVGYEMLNGRRPFTGSSQVEIAMAQVKQQPPELPEAINEDLRRLVMMMLAKAPANRPRSASAVSRILEAIQRGVEPRFSTGAIPVTKVADHDWTGENRVRPGAGSGGTGGSSPRRGPRASPPGTRPAALPLPLSGRGRGIRHRSGASGPSALSAASAGSAPRRSSRSARSANSARSAGSALSAGSAASPSPAPRSTPGGERTPTSAGPAGDRRGGPAADDGVDTPHSSRTVRGTSTTGRKCAGLSLPGLVLVILVLIVVVAAVVGGLCLLPQGAMAGGAPLGAEMPHVAADHAWSATSMDAAVGVGHGTRTGVE